MTEEATAKEDAERTSPDERQHHLGRGMGGRRLAGQVARCATQRWVRAAKQGVGHREADEAPIEEIDSGREHREGAKEEPKRRSGKATDHRRKPPER